MGDASTVPEVACWVGLDDFGIGWAGQLPVHEVIVTAVNQVAGVARICGPAANLSGRTASVVPSTGDPRWPALRQWVDVKGGCQRVAGLG